MHTERSPFSPGDLVLHRPSQQRMKVERRVLAYFRDGCDAYWCTWRTVVGVTRRAMFGADELDRVPSADEPRAERVDVTEPGSIGYGTITTGSIVQAAMEEEVEP